MSSREQRGAALSMALITVAALLGLGATTLCSVQMELAHSGQSRFTESALYAAESGVATGMEFLRNHCDPASKFSAWVSPANASPPQPSQIVGNGLQPGVLGNLFAAGSDEWYEVSILNNREDPGFATGTDDDGTVILRAVGHGPDQTTVAVEADVQDTGCLPTISLLSFRTN
jgi:hypothetical protein